MLSNVRWYRDEAITRVVANVTSTIDAGLLDAADGRVGEAPLRWRR